MNGSEKHYLERLLDPEDRDMIEKEEHFSQVMMMYSCAIREVQTKLEVLNDDLKSRYQRNPIHSIKSRIKKPVSLAIIFCNKRICCNFSIHIFSCFYD